MTAANPNDDAVTNVTEDAGGQYLTFMLAGEEYGVEILKVQEIKGWDTVTPIPNTPDHVLGVLNLRGAVVPIIDLRTRFTLEQIDYGPTTVVIVVKVANEDQERTVGNGRRCSSRRLPSGKQRNPGRPGNGWRCAHRIRTRPSNGRRKDGDFT